MKSNVDSTQAKPDLTMEITQTPERIRVNVNAPAAAPDLSLEEEHGAEGSGSGAVSAESVEVELGAGPPGEGNDSPEEVGATISLLEVVDDPVEGGTQSFQEAASGSVDKALAQLRAAAAALNDSDTSAPLHANDRDAVEGALLGLEALRVEEVGAFALQVWSLENWPRFLALSVPIGDPKPQTINQVLRDESLYPAVLALLANPLPGMFGFALHTLLVESHG